MDRKQVKRRMKQYTAAELKEWRKHAEKCLRDDFEIEECNFVISPIDKRLSEMNDKK